MILTEEQIKADDEQWKARNIKQELYYLGNSIPNRLCVTNDYLRFYAFVTRKALEMVEQLSAQPEIIRCKDCKHLFNKNDEGGKCWHFNGFSKEVSYDDFCSYAESGEVTA